MKSLPQVTLLAVDTRRPDLALQALLRCSQQLLFADILLLCHQEFCDSPLAQTAIQQGIRCIAIPPLDCAKGYSTLMLKGLLPYVHTSHLLVAQWDGFVVNADQWDDGFLQWDYIGAPWPTGKPGKQVGNGGFSLRSRRLLEALATVDIENPHPEDKVLVHYCTEQLAKTWQLRIAPLEIAQRFAFERGNWRAHIFGIHGLFNLWRLMPPQELLPLLRGLDTCILKGKDGKDLCKALIQQGRWDEAELIIQRRTRFDRFKASTHRLRLRLLLQRIIYKWRFGKTRFRSAPEVSK